MLSDNMFSVNFFLKTSHTRLKIVTLHGYYIKMVDTFLLRHTNLLYMCCETRFDGKI
jgi:hypothetical protein